MGPKWPILAGTKKKWNFQGNSTLGETPNRLQLCGNVWMEKKGWMVHFQRRKRLELKLVDGHLRINFSNLTVFEKRMDPRSKKYTWIIQICENFCLFGIFFWWKGTNFTHIGRSRYPISTDSMFFLCWHNVLEKVDVNGSCNPEKPRTTTGDWARKKWGRWVVAKKKSLMVFTQKKNPEVFQGRKMPKKILQSEIWARWRCDS